MYAVFCIVIVTAFYELNEPIVLRSERDKQSRSFFCALFSSSYQANRNRMQTAFHLTGHLELNRKSFLRVPLVYTVITLPSLLEMALLPSQ